MTSLSLGYTADLVQLGDVVERLPIGVIIFEKRSGDVVFANVAARHLVAPATLRARAPLPDPWPSFSLSHYADRLVRTGITAERLVHVDDDHAFSISGISAREPNTAVILIEDTSKRERRSRAEREFIANAAHELLTPLTGIVSAAHVLEAGAKDVPEDRDHFISHIAQECSRLTRIARSLLVLARAQSGEEPPRLEICRVAELLDEVVDECDGPIVVRCEQNLTVLADADLFVQAAINLVGNALRHGSGAEIALEARNVSANLVEIDVVDSRDADADSTEFRARFRSSGGRDSGGFGLGLSIASQSLEVMGGRLLLQPTGARIQLPKGGLPR